MCIWQYGETENIEAGNGETGNGETALPQNNTGQNHSDLRDGQDVYKKHPSLCSTPSSGTGLLSQNTRQFTALGNVKKNIC